MSKEYQKKYNLYSIAGDNTALKILNILRNGDLSAIEIHNKIGGSHSTIFRKLETLFRIKAVSRSKYQIKRSRDGKNYKESVYHLRLRYISISTQFENKLDKTEILL